MSSCSTPDPDPDPCDDPLARAEPCDDSLIESLKAELIVTKTTAYPNPAKAALTVHLPIAADADLTVHLYSLYGQELTSAIITKGEKKVTLDTREISNGIYLIQVQTSLNLPYFNRKVMISHH